MDYAKTTIIGRLANEPEMKVIGNKQLVKFCVACNTGRKEDPASFFDCSAWEKTAEMIYKYCKKGSKVFIEAIPRQERWEKDGKKNSKVVFNVQKIILLDSRPTEEKQVHQKVSDIFSGSEVVYEHFSPTDEEVPF